jgi:hypothetical protein
MGTEQLCRLIQIARDEKLGRLGTEMLRDNRPSIFKRLGFRLRLLRDLSLIQAVLDL